ncbi:MAG TPA: hypothetical protein VGL24_03410 [Chthoniobacterales bacterium]
MNLPFLRYFNFKKDKSAEGGVAVAPSPSPVAPLVKPASERYGKTVMPNVSRIVGLEPAGGFPMTMPVGNPAPVAVTGAPRKISLGSNSSIAVLPKAETSAPVSERAIALQLADLVEHLPAGVLQTMPVDPEKRVLFKASDLERGMSSGRPSVLLRSIFQQAPDFFVTDIEATDVREVLLPFGKVLEQFTAFQVRPDQVIDEAVPQVETPFLQMTIADGERLGKPATPIPAPVVAAAAAAPEVEAAPVAPADVAPEVPETIRPIRLTLPNEIKAEAPAAAAPAPVAEEPAAPKTIRPIRLTLPNDVKKTTDEAAAPAPLAAKKISPNGMGVPATERVPASSGPSIPTPLPSPFAPPAPARIPFKVSPPSNDLRGSVLPATATPPPKPAAVCFSPDGPRVRLPLRNVLRGLSPFQLSGPVDEVPETATIEIPFSIIEPQLSLGRIAVSPAQFQAALPEEWRGLFKIEETEQPVVLPLQEVLQNLPNESLQLRPDQVEVVLTETFETPFSAKAAEDAARMKVAAGPIAKAPVSAEPPDPVPASVAEEITAEDVKLPESSIPATAPAVRSALQVAFDTDEVLDAKAIVAQTSKLPGVSACAIVFSDGLSLAGNIPAEYQTEALCALAPSIVKRINDQMVGASLGPLNGITLYCAKTPVSFFAHGEICLAALHSGGEITAEVRARLSCAARELAAMYASQPNA